MNLNNVKTGIALDCSTDFLSVSVYNNGRIGNFSVETPMHHSEMLIDQIDITLEKMNIGKNDLDFCVCPRGPGSFTGLRLAFSALKAVSLVNSCPLYSFDTLDPWLLCVDFFQGCTIAAIDAKQEKFYVKIRRGKDLLFETRDLTPGQIGDLLDPEEQVLITGPDALKLKEILENMNPGGTFFATEFSAGTAAEALLKMGLCAAEKGDKPMGETDGPVYIRRSEAEDALVSKGITPATEKIDKNPEAYLG